MIHGVRGRDSFLALSRSRHRATAGPIRITCTLDATSAPRLAFAVPRTVGSAVLRNRARRRLRHVFSQIAGAEPLLVPPGDYLIAVRRAEFNSRQAEQWLIQALQKLQVS